jgi:hypothetical protein
MPRYMTYTAQVRGHGHGESGLDVGRGCLHARQDNRVDCLYYLPYNYMLHDLKIQTILQC